MSIVKEFFNKPILWVLVLAMLFLVGLHSKMLGPSHYYTSNYFVQLDVLAVFDTTGFVRLAELFKDDVGMGYAMMHDPEFNTDWLKPFLPFGLHFRSMVHGVDYTTIYVWISPWLSILWFGIGFSAIVLITRQSKYAIYAAGPYLAYMLAVLWFMAIAASRTDASTGPIETMPIEVHLVWWGSFWTALQWCLLSGFLVWGAFRLLIRLKWLTGIDEYADQPLMLYTEDIRDATDKALTSAKSALGNPREGATKVATDARDFWKNSNLDNQKYLGNNATFCPFCGNKTLNPNGECRRCSRQVKKIAASRLSEEVYCRYCGNNILGLEGVNFCHTCGKIIELDDKIKIFAIDSEERGGES